jgi:hypothetical protein
MWTTCPVGRLHGVFHVVGGCGLCAEHCRRTSHAGAACGSAPGPSAGSALPFGLIDVSAVPATR